MKTALSHIAMIQAGIFAQLEKQGDIFYLQAKHFNEEGLINQILYPELKITKKIKKFMLQDGDILFAAKGAKNFATIYREDVGPAVASQTFLVARLTQQFQAMILPEYIAWFINNPITLNQLKGSATGSSIQAISSMILKDLEITIPSLEKQQLIVKIHGLWKKEKDILKTMDQLRETKIQTLLLSAAKQ